jgi:hypothetical protein
VRLAERVHVSVRRYVRERDQPLIDAIDCLCMDITGADRMTEAMTESETREVRSEVYSPSLPRKFHDERGSSRQISAIPICTRTGLIPGAVGLYANISRCIADESYVTLCRVNYRAVSDIARPRSFVSHSYGSLSVGLEVIIAHEQIEGALLLPRDL